MGGEGMRYQYAELLNLLLEMSSFQKRKRKIMNMQRNRKVWFVRRKRAANRNSFWEDPDIELTKDFESTIINMFKELKKNGT